MSLNCIERYNLCRNINGLYPNFNITARLNKRVTASQLSLFLVKLFAKYPVFALQIYRHQGTDDEQQDGRNWEKRLLERVVFEDVVLFRKIVKFDSEVMDSLTLICFPVNTNKPLWALIVSETENEQYLTYATDHALLDGNTGIHFFEDLVRDLANENLEGLSNESVNDRLSSEKGFSKLSDTILFENGKGSVPTAADLTDVYTLLLFFKAKAIAQAFLGKFTSPEIYDYEHKERVHEIVMFNVPPEQVMRLRAFLKKESLTMTPFLHAIIHKCLVETVIEGPTNLKHCVAANSRHLYVDLAEQLRYTYAVGGTFHIVESQASLTECAQGIGAKIQQDLADRSMFKLMGLLDLIKVWDYLKNRDGRSTVTGSNLGNHDIRHGDWAVESMWFCQDCTYLDEFSFNAVSTLQSGMNLTMGWAKDYNEDGKMDEFMRRFKETLEEIVVDI